MSALAPVDANGWHDAGEDFASIPNDCFDVIAKYYDAGFDQFMIARIPGCVRALHLRGSHRTLTF
jgi:hypothetical protein